MPRLLEVVDARTAEGFSGAVLVAEGANVLLADGFGAMHGHRIEAGDAFWIASTAKQFVSAAIMKLTELGQISLDDPLDRFFPSVPTDKARITIRQLLSHTSGFGQSYVSEQQPNRDAALRAMFAEPLESIPGDTFRYANNNLQIAVAIVEVVSGRAYADYARSLWQAAGMTSTGFAGDDRAHRVSPTANGLPSRLTAPSWGGEGVYSTAPDLFRWYRALRDGRVLKPASVETMLTGVPRAQISDGAAALGWFVGRSPAGSKRVYMRGNDDFGANSLIYFYPERDLIIVVLTHSGNAKDLSWSRTVHSDLEHALGL